MATVQALEKEKTPGPEHSRPATSTSPHEPTDSHSPAEATAACATSAVAGTDANAAKAPGALHAADLAAFTKVPLTPPRPKTKYQEDEPSSILTQAYSLGLLDDKAPPPASVYRTGSPPASSSPLVAQKGTRRSHQHSKAAAPPKVRGNPRAFFSHARAQAARRGVVRGWHAAARAVLTPRRHGERRERGPWCAVPATFRCRAHAQDTPRGGGERVPHTDVFATLYLLWQAEAEPVTPLRPARVSAPVPSTPSRLLRAASEKLEKLANLQRARSPSLTESTDGLAGRLGGAPLERNKPSMYMQV